MTLLSHKGQRVCWQHAGVLRQAIAVLDGRTLHLSTQAACFSFSEASPYPVKAVLAQVKAAWRAVPCWSKLKQPNDGEPHARNANP